MEGLSKHAPRIPPVVCDLALLFVGPTFRTTEDAVRSVAGFAAFVTEIWLLANAVVGVYAFSLMSKRKNPWFKASFAVMRVSGSYSNSRLNKCRSKVPVSSHSKRSRIMISNGCTACTARSLSISLAPSGQLNSYVSELKYFSIVSLELRLMTSVCM